MRDLIRSSALLTLFITLLAVAPGCDNGSGGGSGSNDDNGGESAGESAGETEGETGEDETGAVAEDGGVDGDVGDSDCDEQCAFTAACFEEMAGMTMSDEDMAACVDGCNADPEASAIVGQCMEESDGDCTAHMECVAPHMGG